jgi:hypothetical protein
MNRDDEQTLREMRLFTRELLKDASVLPADLAAMLRDYEPELRRSPPGRGTASATSASPSTWPPASGRG